jgi:hypothetical protein
MRRVLSGFGLAAAAAFALGCAPAFAQDASLATPADDPEEALRDPSRVPDSDVIIVEGGRPEGVSRSEIQRQARSIAMEGDVYDQPLARFEDRLCPGIAGLAVEQASFMIDRIRDNAYDFGIRLQDDGCDPNFIVMFTPDSEQAMREMMERQYWLFEFHDAGEKREMLEPGPARVWTWTEPRTRDGMPVPQTRNRVDVPVLSSWMAHSRIYTAVRHDITSVIVMFDTEAARGKSLIQLADYAVMRGLAQTRPSDEASMDSILTLFDEEAPPQRLTLFDRAYMRSLYDWIPNLPAITKITGVSRQLRILDEEAERRAAAQQ